MNPNPLTLTCQSIIESPRSICRSKFSPCPDSSTISSLLQSLIVSSSSILFPALVLLSNKFQPLHHVSPYAMILSYDHCQHQVEGLQSQEIDREITAGRSLVWILLGVISLFLLHNNRWWVSILLHPFFF